MAKIQMEEQQEYSVLPVDSIVHLRIEEVEVVDVNGKNGTWQKLNFTFKIVNILATGDGSPVDGYDDAKSGKIWGSVPFKMTTSPENRLRQWVEAVYGMELAVGFELDTDLLIGKQVRGITSQYTSKAGYPRHQIESLLPYGQGASPVANSVPQNQYAIPQAQYPTAAPGVIPQQQGAPEPVSNPWGNGHYSDEPPF